MRNNIRFLIIQEMLNLTSKKLLKEGFGDALKSLLRSGEKIGSKIIGEVASAAFTKALREGAELTTDEVQALKRAFTAAGLDEAVVVAKTTAESIRRIENTLSNKIYNVEFLQLSIEEKAVLKSAMAGGLDEVAELISKTESSTVKGAVRAAVTVERARGVAEQFARDNAALLRTGKVFTQEDLMAQAKSIARELYGKEIPDAIANEIYLKTKGVLENVLADKDFLKTINAIASKPGYTKVLYDSFMSHIAPYIGKGAAWTVAAVLSIVTVMGFIGWAGTFISNKFCKAMPIFCSDSGSEGEAPKAAEQPPTPRGPRLKGRSASGEGAGKAAGTDSD